jgi:hypothetical protein
VIGPKVPAPTAAEERRAYAVVTERDGQLCQRCLRARGDNRDHRLNRSQGGRTAPSNLQLLCGSGTTGCHGWRTENLRAALEDGWRVPAGQDPREWPARRWLRTRVGTLRAAWVLYDDEGGWREASAEEARRRMGGEAR